jgi:gamma-glutamyl:cysteine ligase YbdK (ATP-grasp superfamily)
MYALAAESPIVDGETTRALGAKRWIVWSEWFERWELTSAGWDVFGRRWAVTE